jgi:hypothetical protein
MASPTFGAAGTYLSGTTSTTAAIAVPTGAAADEVMLAFIYIESTTAITPPSGFTLVDRASNTGAGANDLAVYWKRCTGADSGTYSFSFSSSYREAACCRFSGCITSGNPYDVVGKAAASSSPGGVTPASSNTTTVVDTLQVFAATNFNGSPWTPPTSYTERVDSSADLTVATLAQAAIGASGSITATCSGQNAGSCSMLIALKPPSGTTVSDPAAWRRRRRMSGLFLR